MTPQSSSEEAPWDLTQFSQLPSAALSYFPESHQWSKISSLSKVILVWGKARSHMVPTQGCFSKKLRIRCDAWAGMLSWWSCQSSVANSCGLLIHPNSFRWGMFKLNAKFDTDSLLYSLSHFKCNGHTIHMLTQWHLLPPLTSPVKLSLFMHACSSPLSLAARLPRCHT